MNKNKEISNLANNELLLVMLELNKISEQHNTESNLNENIINHVLSIPGKQLRPSMTIISSKIWNEDVDYKVIKMATAVELLHIATLVHDDTVDFADTRRGEKTASNIWGPHIAVLVGDFLFATSAEYADLAERYEADAEYEAGTVVKIGGDKEITQTTQETDADVFGIISASPGFEMNRGKQ